MAVLSGLSGLWLCWHDVNQSLDIYERQKEIQMVALCMESGRKDRETEQPHGEPDMGWIWHGQFGY
jgi:hypothetical protein